MGRVSLNITNRPRGGGTGSVTDRSDRELSDTKESLKTVTLPRYVTQTKL